ncbi:aminotransferase class III-fold pyridoxal phosphate-dependent enzyme, partial [Mesorhizobium sp. M7A.T.Ca.TU.009.01.3.2]
MHSDTSNTSIGGIGRDRIADLRETEGAAFRKARPKSQAKIGNGLPGFFSGVPMHWMNDWPTPFPILVDNARGATIMDIDGNKLDDFCLGDTGSMFGHSPPPVARAIRRQAGRGLTYMLPSEDALAIGPLLQQRFGLPFWQIATTATDANRFALRVARAVTGREKILVFNGCYHGSVDETMVRLIDGKPVNRPGLAGEFRDLTRTAKVIEFNDVSALEAALGDKDVACVIAEPVLTNSCMVLADPGYHDALRKLTRQTGTLLLIDETHTISTGPGGYTRKYGLDPDFFVLGKPIAGGVPASVWG